MVRFQGAALYLDVVAFSQLMDKLESDRGTEGIEDLLDALDACFEPVTQEIEVHGGKVASVIGDCVVAIWPALAGHTAPLAAAHGCARAIVERARPDSLPVRLAVGAGEIFDATLRDTLIGSRRLVAGPLIGALAAACASAAPGAMVVLPATEQAEDAALPPAGDDRPDRAETGFSSWAAALREATILAVRLHGLSFADWTGFVAARDASVALGRSALRHGGLQEKMQADGKGFISLITFGMPPRIGSYRPEQAFAAATEIKAAMRARGIPVDVGIASGRVFRGQIGRERRLDFTTYGNAVNRAVRLMETSNGRILCDAATRHAVTGKLAFDALAPLLLKGFDEPMAAHSLSLNESGVNETEPLRTGMVGRMAEADRLIEKLRAAVEGTPSATVLLGEAGLGKSVLLERIVQAAAAQGPRILRGRGSPLTTATPYHAWRTVFLDIFGNRADEPTEMQRARILAHLGDDPTQLTLAPLLDAVAPVGLAENPTTRGMSERARATARADLMSRLIARHAHDGPILIVLDDGHWLDEASVGLLADPTLAAAGVSVLVGCRPDEGATNLILRLLDEQSGRETVRLGPLEPRESARLAAGALGVRRLAPAIADWIWSAARGHPLFTEQLAQLLRDRGLVTTESGSAVLTVDNAELQALALPRNVESVVTDRLDRLGPAEQSVFRAASVIGVAFELGLLTAIHPETDAPGALQASVSRLLRAGLLAVPTGEGASTRNLLAFGHPTFRAIGYEQIPREEKRGLHRAVARALEPAAETDPRATCAVLAFHYRLARDHAAALHHYSRAGDFALRDGAYGAARDLLQDAIRIHAAEPELALHPDLPASQCNAWLARAQISVGAFDEASTTAVKALADIGYRWPTSRRQTAARFGGAMLAEMAGILKKPRAPDEWGLQRLRTGIDAAGVLSAIGYFRNRPEQCALASLWATQFAARSHETIPACVPYGWLILMMSLLRLSPVRRYFTRRQEINARNCGPSELHASAVSGWMHHIHFCEWEAAERCLSAHRSVSAGFDDPWLKNNEIAVEGFYYYLRGDLEGSVRTYASLRPLAERQRNRQHLVWSDTGSSRALLAQGRTAEAVPLLESCRRSLAGLPGSMDHLVVEGILAVAYLRSGKLESAASLGMVVLARADAQMPNAFATLDGYGGAVEVWLGLAEALPEDAAAHLARARRAQRRLRLYAMMFPMGRPRFWLFRGFFKLHAGSRRAARRCWRRSLEWATRNGMPVEAQRAKEALASRRPTILSATIGGA